MSLAPYVHVPGAVLVQGAVLHPGADVLHHLRRVLRRRDGAALVVADGEATEATAELVGDEVRVVGRPRRRPDGLASVTVWQAVGKGSRTEDAVRMCTEAGAVGVHLLVTERSVRRPDEVAGERLRQRCEDVAASASAQARRPSLPWVRGPSRLGDLLAGSPEGLVVLDVHGPVLHAGGDAHRALDDGVPHVAASGPGRPFVVAVGPEGGWSDGERSALVDAGGVPIGLAAHVLRTEHAGFAGVVALRTLVDRKLLADHDA